MFPTEPLQNKLGRWLVDLGGEPDHGRASRLLQEIGAESRQHTGGRSLADHLRGTRDLLATWRCPRWIQDAGLFHSVYSTEAYKSQTLCLSQRARLQGAIGTKAEQLVYLFSRLRRDSLFCQNTKKIALIDGTTLSVDDASRDAIVLLCLANHAEQAQRLTRPWLAFCADYARQLSASAIDGCSALQQLAKLDLEQERQLSLAYQLALELAFTDPYRAVTELDRCIAIAPFLIDLWVWKIAFAAMLDDGANVHGYAKQGLNSSAEWPLVWDNRISLAEWRWPLEEILRGQSPSKTVRYLQRLASPRRPASEVIDEAPALPKRMSHYLFRLRNAGDASLLSHYPELHSEPFLDNNRVDIAAALERNFDEIRGEALRLNATMFAEEAERIGRTGRWDVAFLYERGRRNEQVCARCPLTASILESYAELMRSSMGLVYFSRMHPRTHIASHKGPTNLRVRCHLGIAVPSGDCALRVGAEVSRWTEGKCLVFDDALDHEAWNNTDEERMVLIVDLWHPDLTRAEREILTGLHNSLELQAENLSRYWSKNAKKRYSSRDLYH